jgi:hypothetical protein
METLNNTIQSSYPEILNTIGTFGEITPKISSDIKLLSSYQRLNLSVDYAISRSGKIVS